MIVVYTANIGNTKDTLKEPNFVDGNCRFVCFTDKSLKSRSWEIRKINKEYPNEVEVRFFKLNPMLHFPNDITIWIDCSFKLLADPWEMVEKELGEYDMVSFRNPWRDTIEQEAKIISKKFQIDERLLHDQIRTYRKEWPRQSILTCPGICIRRNTIKMENFGKMWWHEYRSWCHTRDQMSIDYCIYKNNVSIKHWNEHYINKNRFAKFFKDK